MRQPGDKEARKLPVLIIPMAQSKLASVFGIEMREVERQSDQARRTDAGELS